MAQVRRVGAELAFEFVVEFVHNPKEERAKTRKMSTPGRYLTLHQRRADDQSIGSEPLENAVGLPVRAVGNSGCRLSSCVRTNSAAQWNQPQKNVVIAKVSQRACRYEEMALPAVAVYRSKTAFSFSRRRRRDTVLTSPITADHPFLLCHDNRHQTPEFPHQVGYGRGRTTDSPE